jgi:two-component system osmolarity sensor histidine kinase EnvZ
MTIKKLRFKKFIPRSLYGRFLLIVILSAVIIQLVSIYVFYYTHLDVISKHMARSVIAEMVFVKTSINKPGYENLLRELTQNTGLEFSFQEKRKLKRKKIGDSDWRKSQFYEFVNPIIDPYNRFKSELQTHGLKPYEIFENPENDDFIIVKIQTFQGVLTFDVPVKKITSSSAYVFIFWMGLTIVITSILSIAFFRNQLRLIRKLSESAEKFGRGQDVSNIRPSGAQEIRSLTISFIRMKERVMRQISQRTDMLSAVSHDLRTPLTRMKLQLEMLKQSSEIDDLKSDVHDMEKLVNEYLDFARGDDKEKINIVKINKFLTEKIISYYLKMNHNITYETKIDNDFEIPIKKLALNRALKNLINNGLNHSSKVYLNTYLSQNNLIIEVEDDGPGIPKKERQNVFKPFYRIDNSRNLDKVNESVGSGLGMAIALDAITSHGGRISLDDSKKYGGLLVRIFIPF